MNTFDKLILEPLETQIKAINEAIRDIKRPLENNRTFAKESGLGVVFSKVKRHLQKYGYIYNGKEFIKGTIDKDSEQIIFENIKAHTDQKAEIRSIRLYADTNEQLKELYKKYPYFKEYEILDTVIKEGINQLIK